MFFFLHKALDLLGGLCTPILKLKTKAKAGINT